MQHLNNAPYYAPFTLKETEIEVNEIDEIVEIDEMDAIDNGN